MLRRALGQLSIVSGLVAGTIVFAAGTAAADVTVTYSVDENGAPTAVVSADPYDPGADAIAANYRPGENPYWLTEPSEPLPLILLRCFDGAWALGPDLPAIEDVSYVTIDPNTFDAIFSPAVLLDQTLCNPLVETTDSSPTSETSETSEMETVVTSDTLETSETDTSEPETSETAEPSVTVSDTETATPTSEPTTQSEEATVTASPTSLDTLASAPTTASSAEVAPQESTVPPAPTTVPGDEGLAATGGLSVKTLSAGLVLLALGAGLTWIGRGRRTAH